MTVTPIEHAGNSSKFLVTVNKRGEFVMALSYTLRTVKWELKNPTQELEAAEQLADALVGRHNPKLPFSKTYVFAEHNTQPTVALMVSYLRKNQIFQGRK